MENNISTEINKWWNDFDLVDKILIKDDIECFCSSEREEDKEDYVNVIAERLG